MSCEHVRVLGAEPIADPANPATTIEAGRCMACGALVDREGRPIAQVATFAQVEKLAAEQRHRRAALDDGAYTPDSGAAMVEPTRTRPPRRPKVPGVEPPNRRV
jgi:hypothetical protein